MKKQKDTAPRRSSRYGQTARAPGMRWLKQTIADAKTAAEKAGQEFTEYVEQAVQEKNERMQK